jgi:cyclic pyranopterin phosphate synthase
MVPKSSDRVIPLFPVRGTTPRPGMKALEGAPRDVLARPLRDLRISVTDRCNFRCTYCMPKDLFGSDYKFLPRSAMLTFEEITRLARIFMLHGVEKIRLTGGEPLLRKDLPRLIEMLAALGTLELTLTTNGSTLARSAQALKGAGLERVTVSLDSLDDAVFRAMNDVDFPVRSVLEGIDAAARAGLAPIKINMVVKRGVNEHSIVPMARHFKASGHIVRFIEYMDVGNRNHWSLDRVVPSRELVERISARWPLHPIQENYHGEVAERYAFDDGAGEIGFISSITNPFCGSCTRARLSSEGVFYTCLFARSGVDLRAPLRGGATDDELRELIRNTWLHRGDRYSELRATLKGEQPLRKIEMYYIGG